MYFLAKTNDVNPLVITTTHPIATIRIPDKYICATYDDVCVLNKNASYTNAILKDAGAWREEENLNFRKRLKCFPLPFPLENK